MDPQRQEFDQLPPTIAERLSRADWSVSMVTPTADRAILEQADAHFSSRSEQLTRWRYWAVPSAVAATVVLALLLVQPTGIFQRDPAANADDIDGSGQVDILDVFALAQLQADNVGQVTQEDIDMLAARIVSVTSGS